MVLLQGDDKSGVKGNTLRVLCARNLRRAHRYSEEWGLVYFFYSILCSDGFVSQFELILLLLFCISLNFAINFFVSMIFFILYLFLLRKETHFKFQRLTYTFLIKGHLSGLSVDNQQLVFERILKCNHPSLGEGNKDKLMAFYVLVLQYLQAIQSLSLFYFNISSAADPLCRILVF